MRLSNLKAPQNFLWVILLLLITPSINAQQTNIGDYVLFGGDGNHSSRIKWYQEDDGYLVSIGNKSTINGGAVGSYQFVKTSGEVRFSGNIFSGEKIHLADRNTVGGRISAGNPSSYKSASLKSGSYSKFQGNIDVQGNIQIGSRSSVEGKVTHPAGTRYSGPVPGGGDNTGTPSLALLPQMPLITTFPKAGYRSVYTSGAISAGAFDQLKLPGNKTVTFSGTGDYTFNSINNNGSNTFIFDFKHQTTGVFKLYIYGDVDLDNIRVKIINGGDASRIYAEVHGNGGSCWDRKSAWNMGNSKGFSCKNESVWEGTVWAPNGGITIGSSSGKVTVNGALLSASKVTIGSYVTLNFVPFSSCTPPIVNAGPDTILNVLQTIKLEGSASSQDVAFEWQGLNGGEIISGANSPTAVVSQTGTYVLTATTAQGCFSTDTVIVKGKGTDIIGPELKSLFISNDKNSPLSKSIFIIQNDSVYIEVIPIDGEYTTVLNLLQSPDFGMTDLISNGESRRIITGKFPIANLLKLNELAELINFCRPLYPALTNAGIAQSAGDSAMKTNYVRNSFGVQGEDINVGVLSDSYNTLPGNPAQNDVVNGDLPGTGNSDNPLPVKILKEFPLGQRSDEGRAMLQIIHDVAPKAQLSFRTGFLSPGDFAAGIRELATDGCNVIVDDITFITEPFFTKGAVDSAIAEVTEKGVVYVTAAGNFSDKSYGSIFNPVDAPAGLTGKAHNFGGGTFLQKVSLNGTAENPGVYTIVLQWVDDIYSLSGTGTRNDLDIYLADDQGNPIKGYNRLNIGGDPIEILPFTVTENTVTNMMVINTSLNPSPNLRFKYVVFRGDFKINEFSSEPSTIVGHSKAAEAITVGAARYSKTPVFGVNLPELESFSSIGGGVLANGIISQKPDLIGPDGVNTTVGFGNVDSEQDGLPNFFGTSAAAPHVAGAAALLLQASRKFYHVLLTPESVKSAFRNTAVNMDAPGFDFRTGFGFINADASIRTIANPTPQLDSLGFADTTLLAGEQPMEMLIYGKYLSADTKIIFGKDTLPTTIRSLTLASVTLPIFFSDKLVSAFSPAISPSALDGGLSNSISIKGIPKKNITVIADNKTKQYGTELPQFTATILVNGDSIQNTTLTVSDLGLTTINYEVNATDLSDVGLYSIIPSVEFAETNTDNQLLLDKYTYTFTKGALNITKLPLKISARDTTLVYGQKAGDFHFNYSFNASTKLGSADALLNTVQSDYKNQLAEDVIGLVNGQAVVIVNGQAVQIINGQAVQIINGQAVVIVNGQAVQIINGQAVQIVNGQAVQIVNGQAVQIVNGQAVVIVNHLTGSQVENLSFLATTSALQGARKLNSTAVINGIKVPQTANVIDVTQESVLGFNSNTSVTSLLFSIPDASPRGMVDVESYTNGQAVQIVNGQAVQIVNGQAVQIVNGQAVQIINGEPVPITGSGNRTAVIINDQDIGTGVNEFKSLNMVTGLDAGEQYIIPGGYSSNNFDISYEPGKLTILPAPLSIKAADTTKMYGADLILDKKRYSIAEGDLMYGDSILSVNLISEGTPGAASPGDYPIIPGSVVLEEGQRVANYDVTYINGKLTVGKAAIIVKANDASRVYWENNPVFSASFSGFINGETFENAGISGKPSFSTTATSGSNVGNYDINISTGNLSSDKYSFSFEKGILHITPAPLYVKADDKVMYQFNSLPRFTGKITNLKTGTTPRIRYKLDPAYSGEAGVYDIVPTLESFLNSNNYSIEYTNGKLYVNPKCGQAKALKIRLNCVEKVSKGKYIAHFYAENDNRTTLYIPAGWNNFIYSTGSFSAISVPEIFAPGTTKFDIPFDGNIITWIVSSYERCWYIPSLDIGAYWSKSCPENLITSTLSRSSLSTGKNKQIATENNINKVVTGNINPLQNKEEGVLGVYPNPVLNKAVIYLSNEEIDVNKAVLYDVNGKIHPIKSGRQIAPNSFEIDMEHLQKGFYLIKVKVREGYKSIMIVKG